MPKVRETILQVKERQTRELRARTEARCAQLLAQGQPRATGRHNLRQTHELRAPTHFTTPNIEEHSNVSQPFKPAST